MLPLTLGVCDVCPQVGTPSGRGTESARTLCLAQKMGGSSAEKVRNIFAAVVSQCASGRAAHQSGFSLSSWSHVHPCHALDTTRWRMGCR